MSHPHRTADWLAPHTNPPADWTKMLMVQVDQEKEQLIPTSSLHIIIIQSSSVVSTRWFLCASQSHSLTNFQSYRRQLLLCLTDGPFRWWGEWLYKRQQTSNRKINHSPNWFTNCSFGTNQRTTSDLLLRGITETISATPARPRTWYFHLDSERVTRLHHRGSSSVKTYKPCYQRGKVLFQSCQLRDQLN